MNTLRCGRGLSGLDEYPPRTQVNGAQKRTRKQDSSWNIDAHFYLCFRGVWKNDLNMAEHENPLFRTPKGGL